MEEVSVFLKDLIGKTVSGSSLFRRNRLKEYLQILVLDFIYSHPKYGELIFYGGSCLAHCHGLPRLSEDLDFVDARGKINVQTLADDLENHFGKETDLTVKTTTQKFGIYLKFPILRELSLAGQSESDLLFLKIEVYRSFGFCKSYKIEIVPLFKFNRSLLIRTLDLSTLMSTKIRAVLHRKWEKTDREGKTLAKVKGRDYFDLMWYLEKGVTPNMNCIEDVKDAAALREKLLEIVDKVDSKSIQVDLDALIDDEHYIRNVSKNIKEILKRDITRAIQ